MSATSVPTGGTILVAADPDQWRTVVIQNMGPTNYIEVDYDGAPTLGQGLQIPTTATAWTPPIPLPPGRSLGARANTAACDVRYLVS
jgi:hypothetical protein